MMMLDDDDDVDDADVDDDDDDDDDDDPAEMEVSVCRSAEGTCASFKQGALLPAPGQVQNCERI